MLERLAKSSLFVAAVGRLRLAPWGLVAAVLFAAILISPTFVDGYACDDLLNALTRGNCRLAGKSITEYLAEQAHGSICAGRVYPLAIALTYGLHYLAPSATMYHAFAYGLTLVDVVLFYLLLRAWKFDSSFAAWGTLFLALLFQLRVFYDPIMQFAGLLPATTGASLLALLAFEHYLAGRRAGGWLLVCLAAFIAALLTYEIAFMVTPAFVIAARRHRSRWRDAFAAAYYPLTVAIVLAMFTLGLRYQASLSEENPYNPHFDLAAIGKATLWQASAAAPMSYALVSPHCVDNMCRWQLFSSWQNWAMLLAAGALNGVCAWRCSRRAPEGSPPALGLVALVGIAVWILPGALLALSGKYQCVVAPGLGYLPVFLQAFGLATLAVAIVAWARERFPSRWPRLAIGIVAFEAVAAMLTFESNQTVARRLNRDPNVQDMALLDAAFQAGVCDAAATNSTIWSLQPHPWMGGGPDLAGGHFSTALGRRMYGLIGAPAPGWRQRNRLPVAIAPPTFVLNDSRPDAQSGYVIVAAVDNRDRAGNSPAPDVRDLQIKPNDPDSSGAKYRVRRFRLYVTGEFARLAQSPGHLAAVIVEPDAAGAFVSPSLEPMDLGTLEIVCRTDQGLVLAGEFTEAVDLAWFRVLPLEGGAAELARCEK